MQTYYVVSELDVNGDIVNVTCTSKSLREARAEFARADAPAILEKQKRGDYLQDSEWITLEEK